MSSDLDKDADSVHAIFQSFDGMEGLDAGSTTVAAQSQPTNWREIFHRIYPGLLVAATIALAATWLAQQYRSPVMLFALLFGMAFHFLYEEGRCVAGIEFSSKAVLRFGVAMLGARITARQILELGVMPIATVVAAIVSTIASVLPHTSENERDTILTVVTVTLLSTLAMILYPLFATTIGLDHVHAGIFLGGTIHDVAQVVGAGYSISTQTGDVATYVKLLRVAMLLPVVLSIAFVVSRGAKGGQGGAKVNLPLFLVGFAALVALNSAGLFPKAVTDLANDVSRWCLVTAIAALGMKTSFKDLAAVGWRPIALMVRETAWIAAVTVAAVLLA